MNYFQHPNPNGEEDVQSNLPGEMLNNYFQPAPQYDYSNEFFAGGPDGETGGPSGYYQEQEQHQHPVNPVPPQFEQHYDSSPERIGGFFPGPPSGNGAPFPNWPPAPSFPNFPGSGGGGGAPGQQPGSQMGGMNNQPPMGPPPNFVPQKQNVQTFAVDPGGIRYCRFRFTYIWPNHGRGFWAFPTFVGRNSIAGFRWNGFRWVYFGMDLNSIESFQCM
ncbi:hypothetical protein [Oceanobacillus sp. J11TS1]|uniref:hypothetical protein n=1 Tax=Oceanobacillus sp. J11TS1 TaxID=2807191 RepID=UPI001AFF186B|nr:hypothetical protein [Oceanobacillus sp. J11TS1]GIO23311.1 hypothetical protein J11TS1_18920 [Oceanobacillus sp. J11TS1]